MEGIRDGRRLMQVARDSDKPILALKANVGQLGKNIAASHTASLSSDDKVVDAAFRQCGIIRIHDATSLVHTVKIMQLPLLKGKNLAILSRSGGHAVVAADACELAGFNLAPFPQAFIRDIEERMRASVIKLTNPLDLGDLFDLDLYSEILERILKQPWADGIIFLYTSVSESERDKTRQLIQRMDDLSHAYDKPIAFYLSTARQEVEYAKQNYNLPIFTQVVETVRALKHSHDHYHNLQAMHNRKTPPQISVNRSAVAALIQEATTQGRDLLLHEALQALKHYGIPVVQSIQATTPQEVKAAAARIDAPVAIKVIARQLSHKSDVGGVQLDLQDPAQAAQAFQAMTQRIHHAHPTAHIDGVLVQPMITGGHELILGGRQDAQFGPVVLVGIGGIFVEILQQVSLRVAPISRREALDMLEELQGASILMGARGHKRADIEATVNALLRVSQLLCDFPAIRELDINPLRVLSESKGCQALDARIIL
jgi:acetyltransferase